MCARDRIQARRQAFVQDLQDEALDLQAVQEYLQAPSKFRIFGWNTKGTSGWRRGW